MKQYRLVTRSDMDGLVCAVLLRELGMLGEVKFVHPKDVQDGKIEFSEDDITTNLPYVPNVHLSFDHHHSEILRVEKEGPNHVIEADAPSTARVVYNHFGGRKAFPDIRPEMLLAVDKADAAQFSREDVLDPRGWELLSFIMDPRTGLGRFRDFRISNYNLMMDLIAYCKNHTIEEILALPDVKERTDLYFKYQQEFKAQLLSCSTVYDNAVVLDLREEDPIYPGNRFMIYALFPECNVSIHAIWGLKKQNTVYAIGKSIFNRSSKLDIGALALEYGGGGHESAGTCQINNDDAAFVLQELIARIKAVG